MYILVEVNLGDMGKTAEDDGGGGGGHFWPNFS